MLKKQFLIFDLDGTLVNSVPDLTIAVNEMLASFTKKSYTQQEVEPWIGNGVELLVKRALSGSSKVDENLDDDIIENATKIYLEKYTALDNANTVLYPDVIESLTSLKEKGFTLGLVTNKPHKFVAKLLDKMGLNSFFDEAIGANFLEKKKPDPMPLLWITKQLGFKTEDSVMIGDSTNDIKAAQNAGMDSIGLTYGYNYNKPIQEANPTQVVNHFKELLDVLIYDA